MLSPEVLHFKEPASVFKSHKIDKNTCFQKISQFNFVHLITVVLPDTTTIIDTFGEELTSSDYYKILSFNIGDLVTKPFLKNFIDRGNLNLLSINTRIDCDNCIAISSTGKLLLHLDKLTFQTLGLEGKVSHFNNLVKEKYIVTVDLKSDDFKSGKCNYERTKSCLQKLKNFDVILSWEPPEKEICPSSIAKYFSDLGYPVELCKIRHHRKTAHSLMVPVIPNLDEFDDEASANFIEWLGMLCIGGSLNERLDFISTYSIPEPSTYTGEVKILQWRGFFSSKDVARLIKQLEIYFGSNRLWKAVYFQGFSDSPVVWGLNEHHYYTSGDNGSVVIMKGQEYYLCLQKCSNKRYK
ncbi:hypothetical protein WA026_021828 [Henosepilachna vigintioctopunctata]|uniref:Uncharacterized protein n=1 Tax=Henosepilachna vigintioctopunctata TaxID=420089 RepID=A0AAW1UP04_9CUCU